MGRAHTADVGRGLEGLGRYERDRSGQVTRWGDPGGGEGLAEMSPLVLSHGPLPPRRAWLIQALRSVVAGGQGTDTRRRAVRTVVRLCLGSWRDQGSLQVGMGPWSVLLSRVGGSRGGRASLDGLQWAWKVYLWLACVPGVGAWPFAGSTRLLGEHVVLESAKSRGRSEPCPHSAPRASGKQSRQGGCRLMGVGAKGSRGSREQGRLRPEGGPVRSLNFLEKTKRLDTVPERHGWMAWGQEGQLCHPLSSQPWASSPELSVAPCARLR